MKKIIFYVLLIAGCFWANEANAQWGFSITQGQRGNCVGCGDIEITVINFGTIPINGFPTRQECDAARQSIAGISQTFVCGCTLYVICSSCTGSDIVMPGMGNGVDISAGVNNGNVSGTSQGNSFYSPNQGQAMVDAMEQKKHQNDVLLGDANSNRTITRNRAFDNAYAKLAQGRAGAIGGFIANPSASGGNAGTGGQLFQVKPPTHAKEIEGFKYPKVEQDPTAVQTSNGNVTTLIGLTKVNPINQGDLMPGVIELGDIGGVDFNINQKLKKIEAEAKQRQREKQEINKKLDEELEKIIAPEGVQIENQGEAANKMGGKIEENYGKQIDESTDKVKGAEAAKSEAEKENNEAKKENCIKNLEEAQQKQKQAEDNYDIAMEWFCSKFPNSPQAIKYKRLKNEKQPSK